MTTIPCERDALVRARIAKRPADADEFVVRSVCTNVGADPELNAWSGVHTRLGAELTASGQRVDGVIIRDWVCGCSGRPCPNPAAGNSRKTVVGPYPLPPPCIYMLPGEIPSAQATYATAQPREAVELCAAFHDAFGGREAEIHFVDVELAMRGAQVLRRTLIRRDGQPQRASKPTLIRRG